jgi:fructosamine-3-kinase
MVAPCHEAPTADAGQSEGVEDRYDDSGSQVWRDGWPIGCPPLAQAELLAGGLVCQVCRGRLVDGRRVVVKRCPYPADVEADGLRALADAGAPVPAVLAVGAHVLVLELVEGPEDWEALGRAVARMHRATGPAYGWHLDNSGGLTVQRNGWCDDWPSFFVERRVRAHLHDPRVPPALRVRLARACDGPLPALLPTRPPASLTHGDLWGGNVVAGRWLVDPAVCYADRELDLAFMQMSGSLPKALFEGYLAEWPVDDGYERRRPALQLHKLLNSLRHFGASVVPRI